MTTIQFSYYELSLLSFLRESHPDKANDTDFIHTRAEMASAAHADAFDAGHSQPECAEIATQVLYQGLHFSKHDTLVSVLWNEFSSDVPPEKAKDTAIHLQPLVEEIFTKYPLDDSFGYSVEYTSLYTELTGAIQLKLEEDGCL